MADMNAHLGYLTFDGLSVVKIPGYCLTQFSSDPHLCLIAYQPVQLLHEFFGLLNQKQGPR